LERVPISLFLKKTMMPLPQMTEPKQTYDEQPEVQSKEVQSKEVQSKEMQSKEASWTLICRRLRAELGEDVFTSWFGRLELDALNEGTAHLSVPTKFLKSWILSHYTDRILGALALEFSGVKRLMISVRSSARAAARPARPQEHGQSQGADAPTGFQEPSRSVFLSAAEPQRSSATQSQDKSGKALVREPPETDGLSGSPLDRRLNFASFLVGKSNQLAHTEAQRVAAAVSSEPLLYNPLYIHASVGLGKTHLLQAIAHAVGSAKRRVI